MGNIVRVRVKIRGTRPLLQHRFGPDAIPLEKGERIGVAGNDPEEWKRSCMVTDNGTLYLDGTYVFACLRDGAKHTKKGKGSIQAMVAATLQVEDSIILLNRTKPEGVPPRDPTQPVYLDVRGVRNPSTKARNVRYRLACSPGWECGFTLAWDKTVVAREVMRGVLNDASVLAGLGNGRSIGFGRFCVVTWEVLEDAQETPATGSVEQPAEDRVPARRRKVPAVLETADTDNGAH